MDLKAYAEASGKDGGAAEIEAKRRGDAGEVLQYLMEQSVDIATLLDPETLKCRLSKNMHCNSQQGSAKKSRPLVEMHVEPEHALLDPDTNLTRNLAEIHAAPHWLWVALVKQMI